MDDQQPAGLKEDGQQTLRALSNFETRLVIILLHSILGILEAFGGNYVLSVRIEGPVTGIPFTIYHHETCCIYGLVSSPSINQPTNGKGTSTLW